MLLSESIGIPPPPSTHSYPKIVKEVLIEAEKESKASMEKAAKEVPNQIGMDLTTKCAHFQHL